MASLETGEMFTQEQFDSMPPSKRRDLKLVSLTPEESQMLSTMNRKDRRAWLKANKKLKAPTQSGDNK